MSDIIKSSRRPAWLPVLAMLLILPVLLWLGLWQLDRADQKRTMFEQFGSDASVLDQQTLIAATPLELRYRRATLSGQLQSDRQFLLEGMSLDGRPGLHVLTPFDLGNGQIVMVNRGWIPETRTRQTVPELAVDGDERIVQGRVVPYPQPGLKLQAEQSDQWPRRMVYPDHNDIGKALGVAVLPHMLWLDADQPDGFARDWSPSEFGPARHVGYAVQWFGLAVTLVLIYIVLRFRRGRGKQSN